MSAAVVTVERFFHNPYLDRVSVVTRRYLNVIQAARGVRRPFMELNSLLVKYCCELVDQHNKATHGTKPDIDKAVAKYVSAKHGWFLLTRIQCT